jgi:TolB protein
MILPLSERRFFPLLSSFLIAVALLATGCDDETLGPNARGDIEGEVRDAESGDPIADASISTSPPTQSVLTDDDGTFALRDVETGNYTVDISKNGYETAAVGVRVAENKVAQATALLNRSDDFGSETDSLRAEVVGFYNDRVNRDSTGADSVFVTAEYRAENVGETTITAYEIYFRIETPAGVFSREEVGDTLNVGQADIGEFRTYIQHDEAEAVDITGTYISTE